MSTSWKHLPALVFDTETTGLDPAKDRIVELGSIGCCIGDPSVLHVPRGCIVDPGIPIPIEASRIHGITDEKAKGRPKLADIAERFLIHVREARVLVAYNAPFDLGFLAAALGQPWADAIAGKLVVDPLVLVRLVGARWSGQGRHKLTSAAKRLGVEPGEAHRASGDCLTTLRVLRTLLAHLPDDEGQCRRLLERKGAEQESDFATWKARQPARESAYEADAAGDGLDATIF